MTMFLFHPLPLTGTMNACAADVTPGIAARLDVMSAKSAVRRSSGTPARRRSRVTTRTPSCRKPASSVIRLRRLRTNSSAPTTSTSDSATCATTSARRMPKRSRVSVEPRLPAFMAAPGAVPVARIAGTRPKIRHVTTPSAAVNAKIRQSSESATKMRLLSVVRNSTRKRLSHCASSAPHAAPIAAISRLSASSWRTMRPRDAPIARRTAISRSRAVARASIRFARLAHAISSTRPVVASSSQSGDSYCGAELRDAGAAWIRPELELQIVFRVFGAVGRERRLKYRRRDRGELRARLFDRHPGLQAAHRAEKPDVFLVERRARAAREGLGAERHRDVERAADLHPEEARRRHADDLERVAVERDAAAEDRRAAGVLTLPESVAEHRGRRRAAAPIVGGGQRASDECRHAEPFEEVAAHPESLRVARLAAGREVERRRVPGERVGEHLLPIAHQFPQRVREAGTPARKLTGAAADRVGDPDLDELVGALTGSVRMRTASRSWKMAVFAPTPSASDRIATTANAGFKRSSRAPYFRSRHALSRNPIVFI